MLSPLEIEKKKFSKTAFGYSEREVNVFLAEIVLDYEKIYKENIEAKDKLRTLEDGMKHYKTVEETLQQTLLVAQNTAEEVKGAASQKAEVIIKEAELQAKAVIDNANRELIELNSRCDELKTFFNVSKAKMESILNSQLEILKQSEIK